MSSIRINPTSMALLFIDAESDAVLALLRGFMNHPEEIEVLNEKFGLQLRADEIELLVGAYDASNLVDAAGEVVLLTGRHADALNTFLRAIFNRETVLASTSPLRLKPEHRKVLVTVWGKARNH